MTKAAKDSRRSPASRAPKVAAGADDRTRQARGDARRQQILDAAVELFADKGFRGTGVAALADKVGMTAPGLFYYFGTKERLLREVMAERSRAEVTDLPSLQELRMEMLYDVARHNVETAVLTRLYVVLAAESLDPDDPLHDFFVERYDAGRTIVQEILLAEQQRGRLRRGDHVDAEQLACEVIAVLMGLEIQWLMDPKRVDLIARIDAYLDRLIDELTARPAGATPRAAGASGRRSTSR
jgi:AcrR family transcriptional regulator